MKSFRGVRSLGLFGFRASTFAGLAIAAAVAVQPASAQRFSDPDTLAPAYPSPQSVVDQMLSIAQVKPGETVYDLGCGDGRIVISAARDFKAKAVGIELRKDIFERTRARVASLGLADDVQIVKGDALKYDLSPADVVTLYLLTSSNERLKPALVKYLRPSARVVSHDFEIRGWTPLTVHRVSVDGRPHTIYLYRMDSIHSDESQPEPRTK